VQAVVVKVVRRRVTRLVLFVFGLLGAGLVLAAPALAHASVVGSDPVDGSRLARAPLLVTVTFDQPVSIDGVGYLHVTNQDGKTVDAGPAYHPSGDGTKIAVRLEPHLDDGTYTASFRIISADSHPVAGVIRFVIGNGPLLTTGGAGPGSTTNAAVSAVFDVTRWVSYAGVAVLGGAWLVLTVWPAGRIDPRARRLLWTGWVAAVVGAVGELLLQGPFTAGTGLATILRPGLINDTLHGTYGQLHCVRLVLLGLLALVLAGALQDSRERPQREAALLLGLGVALTFAAVGHANTTPPRWLSVPLDMAHLLAMAAWLGGLVMLTVAVLPRREPGDLAAVLPVHSTVAFTSVVVLAGTGAWAAWNGIGTTSAVFTTTYGLLVLGKIALFLGLLALGNVSRVVVQRHYVRRTVAFAMADAAVVDAPTQHGGVEPVAAERLRRAVLVESLVGLVVLALTAVLVAEPRGKEALATQYRQPITATAPLTSSTDVSITIDPGVHGPVDVAVTLPSPVERVTATATQQAARIGPLPIPLRGGGTQYSGTVTLPVAGTWNVQLTVFRSQLDAVATDTDITLH
jgi:copper transport protein